MRVEASVVVGWQQPGEIVVNQLLFDDERRLSEFGVPDKLLFKLLTPGVIRPSQQVSSDG